MTKTINLADIRIDGGTQARASLDEETVADYAAAIEDGAEFPAIVVFFDGSAHWLADGFHRFHAQRKAGAANVLAEVRKGTRRDAILHSVGANANHGLRRTNDDKRRSVMTLLEDEEWSKWSDREIARKCAVSQPFVSGLRPKQTADTDNGYQYDPFQPRTFTHPKTGEETEMRTGKIGKTKADRDAEKAENERQRQEHLAKLKPETRKSIEDRQTAIETRKQQAGEPADDRAERIAELEEAVATLESDNATLKAENKKFGEMRAQFEKGGFEEVISGKDEEIRVLETRLYRESEDKASWMRSAKFWKAEALKLGYSRDEVIDIETGEVVNG